MCDVKGMAGVAVLRALRSLHPRTRAAASGGLPVPAESVPPPASCVLSPGWRTPPVRTLQLCSALCAGHNKWSKVKHIKGPKDEARGRMFMKFGMMIKMAVKGETADSEKRKSDNIRRVSPPAMANFNLCFIRRGWIQPRHEYKLSPDTGAVQKQEHAQSIHRNCHQERCRLTTQCHTGESE